MVPVPWLLNKLWKISAAHSSNSLCLWFLWGQSEKVKMRARPNTAYSSSRQSSFISDTSNSSTCLRWPYRQPETLWIARNKKTAKKNWMNMEKKKRYTQNFNFYLKWDEWNGRKRLHSSWLLLYKFLTNTWNVLNKPSQMVPTVTISNFKIPTCVNALQPTIVDKNWIFKNWMEQHFVKSLWLHRWVFNFNSYLKCLLLSNSKMFLFNKLSTAIRFVSFRFVFCFFPCALRQGNVLTAWRSVNECCRFRNVLLFSCKIIHIISNAFRCALSLHPVRSLVCCSCACSSAVSFGMKAKGFTLHAYSTSAKHPSFNWMDDVEYKEYVCVYMIKMHNHIVVAVAVVGASTVATAVVLDILAVWIVIIRCCVLFAQ